MELVYIKEQNRNTIVYLDDNKYYAREYIGATSKSVDKEFLSVFQLFNLSGDYHRLPNYGQYEVYLDNQTGLKHYFYNDVEDYNLLFLNNGSYAISYLGTSNKKSKTKIFNIKNKVIVCTFLGLLLALNNNAKPEITAIPNTTISDYKPSDIEKMIFSSPTLSEEEKQYLYNEAFINDMLTIVNDSYYEKEKIPECFNNISIVGYYDLEHENQAGYYTTDTPNILYIKQYTAFEEGKKATIAHEFAHLSQKKYTYNLITEASADIITKEYFFKDYKFGYPKQVKLLKKMMEIIGAYPIWYYNFTGDFSKAEERIAPYLTQEEYINFTNDLSFDHDNPEKNEPKYQELDALLNILYYRIYKKNIEADEIISLIENEDQNLVRYYFNREKINQENSYYLDYSLGTYETIGYKEAIARGIVSAYNISYIEISKEAAFKIIEDGTYNLKRDLDYKTHNISIYHSKHTPYKYTITANIDGIKYEEADVDELVKEGIVDVTYYIIDRKNITLSDYENHKYQDEEIYFITDRYAIKNKDSIDVLVPSKIYLPTIDTRYQDSFQYIKKKKITSQ